MKRRTLVIRGRRRFRVPQHIVRLDKPGTHGWQVRYGGTEKAFFGDHSHDQRGAAAALAAATKELKRRIQKLPAPTGLRREPHAQKGNALPVGISGPIERLRKGRNVVEYSYGVTIPRFGLKPTNKTIYIGTENTVTAKKRKEALAKAIELRTRAERAYQTAATRAKRAGK